MWFGGFDVLHMRGGGDIIAANVTCQPASTFSVPSSPLQYEILVILLGDPQFERVFQQDLFRFEPHVCQMSRSYPPKPPDMSRLSCNVARHQTRGHLFVSGSLPSHVDKNRFQSCKASWEL